MLKRSIKFNNEREKTRFAGKINNIEKQRNLLVNT